MPQAVLQNLRAVDIEFVGQVRHPCGERDVLPHGPGVGLGTVGNGVHTNHGQLVQLTVGDLGLSGGLRNEQPLVLRNHQPAGSGVGDLVNGVLKVVPGGDAAGQVGNTGVDLSAVLVRSKDCGVDLLHGATSSIGRGAGLFSPGPSRCA